MARPKGAELVTVLVTKEPQPRLSGAPEQRGLGSAAG